MPTSAPRPGAAPSASLTAGLLIGVTLIAFESLAVVTVAPRLSAALDGVDLYGWVFSAFLLASLPAIVVAGAAADRSGPGRPLALALALFAVGLAAAGAAPTMGWLIAARAVQGLGGGALVTLLYVVLTRAYPDAQRPRVIALMSSAWVLPALLGPAAAGLAADAFGWRTVFYGVLPILVLVALLTLPAVARLGPPPAQPPTPGRIALALRLAVGAGVALLGLGGAGSAPPALVVALTLIGAALLGPALARLLPDGTLRVRRGLPAVIAARSLAFPAFVGTEALLSLTLIGLRGWGAGQAGAVLAVGAISWTVGSWAQERLDAADGGRRRSRRLAAGAALVALGVAVQAAALLEGAPVLAATVGGWLAAGLGMGLAHASGTALAFALAGDDRAGEVSAALQLGDQLGAGLATGIGGALAAVAASLGAGRGVGVAVGYALFAAAAAAAIAAARRGGRGPGEEGAGAPLGVSAD